MLRVSEKTQDAYFAKSCARRFNWQTENPFVREAERDLLAVLAISPGSRVLEVGCGTGSNLGNLRVLEASFSFTGADINQAEIELARRRFPDDHFLLGDAAAIPLQDAFFDVVFCRDLLHHLELSRQRLVIEEMARLARSGGRVLIIESNALNPVIRAFGALVKAERGVLFSTPERIAALVRQVPQLEAVAPAAVFAEPCNLFRIMLHYRSGLSWLARYGAVRRGLRCMNEAAARVVPPRRWAYMVVSAIRK